MAGYARKKTPIGVTSCSISSVSGSTRSLQGNYSLPLPLNLAAKGVLNYASAFERRTYFRTKSAGTSAPLSRRHPAALSTSWNSRASLSAPPTPGRHQLSHGWNPWPPASFQCTATPLAQIANETLFRRLDCAAATEKSCCGQAPIKQVQPKVLP